MKITDQISMEDISPEYKAFVEKFKPKKTTDDCYTPAPVFEVVAQYVEKHYGIERERFVRPFYPGEDYAKRDYPEGCCVVDNPPFSILSRIVRDYMRAGIRFFMFCPHLTCFNIAAGIKGVTKIVCSAEVTYENGAVVNTSFITNMETGIVARSDSRLHNDIERASKVYQRKNKKQNPKYIYPDHVLTATMLGYLSVHGVDFAVREEDTFFIRNLDAQRAKGKGIFGTGYLLSDRAANEKKAAEKTAAQFQKEYDENGGVIVWMLSDRERRIIKSLGESTQENDHADRMKCS